jgi:glycosidase
MTWAKNGVFYHIYPLGACGAPRENRFGDPPVNRLDKIYGWIDHIASLGFTAVYLGPVFQSGSHGYDTVDYRTVDSRLGENETLAGLVSAFHERGIKVVLDAVLNHSGRDFFAFRDLQENGAESPFRDWYAGITFSGTNRHGDPFSYHTWDGHDSLVKFNLENEETVRYLLDSVEMWISEFGIDGLRIDAADVIAPRFLTRLRERCEALRDDFWLMGEVVHGDYRDWVKDHMLHSVTNYEVYKGLYSSHNDANYFEISYSLNRQFGEEGIYRNMMLYNFVDNHDVDRIKSTLNDPNHLYPIHILLFTIPGIPSIYYGSEYALPGIRTETSDAALRPEMDPDRFSRESPEPHLKRVITKLASLRKELPGLAGNKFKVLHTDHRTFAFQRTAPDQSVITAVNSSGEEALLEVKMPFTEGTVTDRLNGGKEYRVTGGILRISLSSCWGAVLVRET